MKNKKKSGVWLKANLEIRLFIYLFSFSTLVNGAMSWRSHFHSQEMKIPEGKRTGKLEQNYEINQIHENKTINNGNVLLSTRFDKMLHWLFDNEAEKGNRNFGAESSRFKLGHRLKLGERFAFRRRLQFALLPIMYKMGVMTTLLTGLTILVLKGLTIGVILLIFAFGNYFTKLHKASAHSAQPIHVHVHSQDGHKYTSFPTSVDPWERATDEVHPSAYLSDEELESYRRRLIQNSAAAVKLKQLAYNMI